MANRNTKIKLSSKSKTSKKDGLIRKILNKKGLAGGIAATFIILIALGVAIGVASCNRNPAAERVVTINGENSIYMDEALWYIYLTEKELKVDADEYMDINGESYWKVKYDDSNTVEEAVKDNVMQQMIYYEVLSAQAKKTGSFEIEDDGSYATEANTMMIDINSKLRKKGLTQAGYEKVLAKIAQTDLYYDSVLDLYEVDEEKIKEANPYSEDEYDDMATYNDYIASLVETEKTTQFNTDYETLLAQYDIDVNDKVWDKVKIGELANLMDKE